MIFCQFLNIFGFNLLYKKGFCLQVRSWRGGAEGWRSLGEGGGMGEFEGGGVTLSLNQGMPNISYHLGTVHLHLKPNIAQPNGVLIATGSPLSPDLISS